MRRFTIATIDGEQVLLENTTLSTLISGEDQTNDCLVVENQNGYYIFDHGAATADEILGTTGASGDLLVRVTVTEAPTSQTIDIYDGTVAAGDLILSIPTGAAIGDTWELGILSKNGGFTADDKADTTGIAVCVGRFS